jgi:hypothetical protein
MSNHDATRFLNSAGQVTQWPTKQADKSVVAYLAGKFEPDGSRYQRTAKPLDPEA